MHFWKLYQNTITETTDSHSVIKFPRCLWITPIKPSWGTKFIQRYFYNSLAPVIAQAIHHATFIISDRWANLTKIILSYFFSGVYIKLRHAPINHRIDQKRAYHPITFPSIHMIKIMFFGYMFVYRFFIQCFGLDLVHTVATILLFLCCRDFDFGTTF